VLTSHQIPRAFHFGGAAVTSVAISTGSRHSLWVIASCFSQQITAHRFISIVQGHSYRS
jgi:hypothetical protein